MTAVSMKERFDGAQVSAFPVAPDMSLIDNGRRPAVPMPSELFGPVWSIICDVADQTATAPDYAAMGYLAAAASLIGGKRKVRPYGDWSEPCILWCAALGDPSSRKSAPLDAMARPLYRIEQDARDLHKDALREWEGECERAKLERAKWQKDVEQFAGSTASTPVMPEIAVAPERPGERRTIISDVTPEAAAHVLSANPQGVLCFNDELAGWLESFDRYTSGGRPFWLSAFGGRPHSVTRKGSGSIFIKFTGISVLGSIQPDKVVPLLDGANDGLIPRILWAWPEKMPPRRPTARADVAALEAIYRRLDSLAWGQDADGEQCAVILEMTAKASDLFHAWEIENAQTDGDGGPLYESFAGKMPGAVARLALVAELTAWACSNDPEPREVSVASVAAAIKWVEDYAKPMAQRVYGDAAVPPAERHAALLARYVRKHELRTINLRELRRSPHKSVLKPLQPKGALEDAVEVMANAGWLDAVPSREGEAPGQLRKDYRVNPLALERRQ